MQRSFRIRRALLAAIALSAVVALPWIEARAQAATTPKAPPGVETIAPGQLTVLYNPATPPTSFIRNGQPVGMAIDLLTEAARRIGVQPVFRAHADIAGALPAISNGQYDVAALGLMRTPEREAVVDFFPDRPGLGIKVRREVLGRPLVEVS